MLFNAHKNKCQHIGNKNTCENYSIEGAEATNISNERHLGVVIDESLDYNRQCSRAVLSANKIMGIINKIMGIINMIMGIINKIMGIINKIVGIINKIMGIINKIMGIINKIMGIINKIIGIINKIMGIINKIMGIINKIMGIINKIMGIINKIMGIINRTYSFKCKDNILNLYKSLVTPHHVYCCQAWRP